MKRLMKGIIFCAGLISIPVAVNYCIFKKANVKVSATQKEETYDWRHGKVRYVVAGQGEPIVLLHGIGAGCSLMEWEKNIDMLAKHYKVYTLDFIGFGNSDKPGISYSAYLYITLINDFVKNVIGTKTGVIASSAAGAYAVMAYYFEPALYNKMILISPTGVGTTKMMPTGNSTWIRWMLESPVLGTTIYNLLTSKFYFRWFLEEFYYEGEKPAQKNRDAFYYSAHYRGVNAKLPIAAFISRFLNVSVEHALPGLEIPVHVVWGDNNELNPIKNYHEFERRCPNVDLTIFEGAKLMPHAERPKEFYKVCRDFFQ